MKQLLAYVVFIVLTGRVVEASLWTSDPIVLLAPRTLAILTAATLCVGFLFRED